MRRRDSRKVKEREEEEEVEVGFRLVFDEINFILCDLDESKI